MENLTLAILIVLAVAAVRARDLVAATAILGAYSLMMAFLWAQMNALDVSFTEAAVGAGISTVLMLAAIRRIGRSERRTSYNLMVGPVLSTLRVRRDEWERRGQRAWMDKAGALIVCALVGMAMLYGMRDMPRVGDPNSPANSHPLVAQRYIHKSPNLHGHHEPYGEVGSANIVTSVLGDYRGYDTMGETVVIFTASLCVLLLLRGAGTPRRREEDETPPSPSGGS